MIAIKCIKNTVALGFRDIRRLVFAILIDLNEVESGVLFRLVNCAEIPVLTLPKQCFWSWQGILPSPVPIFTSAKTELSSEWRNLAHILPSAAAGERNEAADAAVYHAVW